MTEDGLWLLFYYPIHWQTNDSENRNHIGLLSSLQNQGFPFHIYPQN